jgi:hypothetical protein
MDRHGRYQRVAQVAATRGTNDTFFPKSGRARAIAWATKIHKFCGDPYWPRPSDRILAPGSGWRGLLYDGGGGHAAAALLHVECRIGTAVHFTRRRHKEARLRKLKQFGDIFTFTDAVALLAARKQRDWSGSAVAPLAFMTVQRFKA